VARRGLSTGRLIVGAALILLGILFLVANTTDLELDEFFGDYWPLFLIGFGLWVTVASRGRNVVGLVLLFLGIGFLLSQLDVIDDDWIGDWGWPVLLILIGGWLILFRPWSRHNEPVTGTPQGFFDVLAVVGSRKERVTGGGWRGGEVTAFLGSAEIDLRQATPPLDGARVEATAFLGSIEVFVPRGWVVTVKSTPILGSIDDHTVVSAATDEARDPDPSHPRLELDATAILGSVEIKH
jgi:hypothetical protein